MEHHSAAQLIEETTMGQAAAAEIAEVVVTREIATTAITHMKKIKSHLAVIMMAIIYTGYLLSDWLLLATDGIYQNSLSKKGWKFQIRKMKSQHPKY